MKKAKFLLRSILQKVMKSPKNTSLRYKVLRQVNTLNLVSPSVRRYIKMSSPHLNNLIIIGCMFTYMSVIFLGLDSNLTSIEAYPYICTARAWLLMAGFSLAFGAMFSKTWRVHSIFTDLKLNKKVSRLGGRAPFLSHQKKKRRKLGTRVV